MAHVVRPYRGVSAEDRRARRRQQLIESALDVVEESGVVGLSVEAVCERVGLSKRYFYESFTNKDALLLGALDHVYDLMLANVLSGPERSLGLAETVRAFITLLSADPRSVRLYVEAPAHPQLSARRHRANQEFAALFLPTLDESSVPPEGRPLAAHLFVAGVTELLTDWLTGRLTSSSAELQHTIVACAEALQRDR